MPRVRVAVVALIVASLAVVLGRDLVVETGAGCTIDPRPDSELEFLGGITTGVPPLPASSPRALPYPRGEWIDSEPLASVNEITRTVREVNACRAVGNLPRLYALYSGAFLDRTVRINSGSPLPGPTGPDGPDPSMPDPAVWRGSWQLPDGRVGAVFTMGHLTPAPDRQYPVYIVFVQVGDRWLIDDAVPFLI